MDGFLPRGMKALDGRAREGDTKGGVGSGFDGGVGGRVIDGGRGIGLGSRLERG
jgi:hypothetical protein